jgi:hypothetical protein
MIKIGCAVALVVMAGAAARADGALAVGSTADVAKDGIAIGTSINYKTPEAADQAALDPKDGTPGAGWAIAATKALAEQRAMANCQITAGDSRRDFCRIEESKCDEN